MWPVIAQLLLAPMGAGIGALLSHRITDETYQDSYVWWFFGYACAGMLSLVFFTDVILYVLIAAILGIYGLKSLQGWVLGVSYAALLWFVTINGQYVLLVSILPACAYFAYHDQHRQMWYIGVLPTLISASLLLL